MIVLMHDIICPSANCQNAMLMKPRYEHAQGHFNFECGHDALFVSTTLLFQYCTIRPNVQSRVIRGRELNNFPNCHGSYQAVNTIQIYQINMRMQSGCNLAASLSSNFHPRSVRFFTNSTTSSEGKAPSPGKFGRM